jgi:hypothetical protein
MGKIDSRPYPVERPSRGTRRAPVSIWQAGVRRLSETGSAVAASRGEPESPSRTKDKRRQTMRFMVIVKANQESEAGVMPDTKILAAMGKYNEELVKNGIMLAGEGLHPTSKGKRVKFSGSQRTVTDGPFAETKELIAGYWLWKAASMDEALEWLKKAPFDGGTEIEIRQVFEAEDFGAELTPELRQQEEALRAQIASKK